MIKYALIRYGPVLIICDLSFVKQHTSVPHHTTSLFSKPLEQKHCNISLCLKLISLGRASGRGMGGMGSFRAVMQDGYAQRAAAAGIYSSHQQLLRQASDPI